MLPSLCSCSQGVAPSTRALGTFSSRLVQGAVASLVVLLAAISPVNAQQVYQIVDLGTLGGTATTPHGINNQGQVVGQSDLSGDGSRHAFLYSNGVMTDLGTLGGVVSSAEAINENGQIVGVSSNTGNLANHAFLYSGGAFTDLGTLGGPDSTAYAINGQGQIVGSSRVSGGSADRAFLYSGGNMSDLGTLGGLYSYAYGINNSGQIVGEASLSSGYNRAFLYSGGSMTNLGTLGGEFSTAAAINNNGQIVGWSLTQTGSLARRAFIYQNGALTDIGNPGDSKWSSARAINDNGHVVGVMSDGGENPRAFLYADGTMVDLNTLLPPNSGWVLTEAIGINDNNHIIGFGTFNGNPRAFLLSPVPPGEGWTFSWPAPNSAWVREENVFTQAETGHVWTFSKTPLFRQLAFVSGSITSQDGVPRSARGLMIADQTLVGLLFQRQFFPIVFLRGSKDPQLTAPSVSAPTVSAEKGSAAPQSERQTPLRDRATKTR